MNKTEVVSVIFDWAGTIIDFGSRAPVDVFRRVFELRGIHVSESQARAPMGKAKLEHIASICRTPEVESLWMEKYGRVPNENDIQSLYVEFLPLQKSVLLDHQLAIPGAREAFEFLRSQKIAIGSSTGYTRELMDVLIPVAKEQGILSDVVICSDDVRAGRPFPWMIYEAMQRLERMPVWRTVVVDDTLVGIEAGVNAGCWTIGVSRTGNELGLSQSELRGLSPSILRERLGQIENRMLQRGASMVIGSVAELPEALSELEVRIRMGERPTQPCLRLDHAMG